MWAFLWFPSKPTTFRINWIHFQVVAKPSLSHYLYTPFIANTQHTYINPWHSRINNDFSMSIRSFEIMKELHFDWLFLLFLSSFAHFSAQKPSFAWKLYNIIWFHLLYPHLYLFLSSLFYLSSFLSRLSQKPRRNSQKSLIWWLTAHLNFFKRRCS